MVELPPAYAAERESLDRVRDSLREAAQQLREDLAEGPRPARDVVIEVAERSHLPVSIVKHALLTLLRDGQVRTVEGYRLQLANP